MMYENRDLSDRFTEKPIAVSQETAPLLSELKVTYIAFISDAM